MDSRVEASPSSSLSHSEHTQTGYHQLYTLSGLDHCNETTEHAQWVQGSLISDRTLQWVKINTLRNDEPPSLGVGKESLNEKYILFEGDL